MSNPYGRPPKFSKEEIVATYEQLKSRRKTAKKIGCSETYVLRVLKQRGISRIGKPANTGPKPRHTREEVIECRKKLGSIKATAEELGYSVPRIYGILNNPNCNKK